MAYCWTNLGPRGVRDSVRGRGGVAGALGGTLDRGSNTTLPPFPTTPAARCFTVTRRLVSSKNTPGGGSLFGLHLANNLPEYNYALFQPKIF
ncbi:hypothetical protein J6590_026714 [Homalodisca vitripennis]|nr:hypothetical protein J6590_026714 [Homalodisca vitripennis]